MAGSVFVTVGTTEFEELVHRMLTEDVIKPLVEQGYSSMTIQYGRGKPRPARETLWGLDIKFYDLKSSLKADIEAAALIIGHAGAGTVLEALEAKKKLIVVINDALMGNHQTELADRLAKDGCLLPTNCSKLPSAIAASKTHTFAPYEKGNPKLFGEYLENLQF